MNLGSSYQSSWNETVKEFNPTSTTRIPPPRDLEPVDLLKVQDGICCNHCNYCCLKLNTFTNHWNFEHKDLPVTTGDRFHKGKVQTFFHPINRHYFEVKLPSSHSRNPFEIFLNKVIPTFQNLEVIIPTNAREIPPLLTQTQWHVHLSTYITNKPLRTKLIMLVTPPPLPQHTLGKLIIHYLNTICTFAKSTSMIVCCLLMECPRLDPIVFYNK